MGPCETPCLHHEGVAVKVNENAKDISKLEMCNAQIKKDVADLKRDQAVLTQKVDSIRYPIWTILILVLGQLALKLMGINL